MLRLQVGVRDENGAVVIAREMSDSGYQQPRLATGDLNTVTSPRVVHELVHHESIAGRAWNRHRSTSDDGEVDLPISIRVDREVQIEVTRDRISVRSVQVHFFRLVRTKKQAGMEYHPSSAATAAEPTYNGTSARTLKLAIMYQPPPIRNPMHSRASSSTGRAVEQIITAVRLAALVIFVELALRVSSVERVCRLLDVSFDVSTCASTDLYDQSDPHVVRSQRRVERVSRRIGMGDRCLRRCVVLAVEIRGSTPILRIGVRRLNDKSFAAHSWLELAGGSLDSDAKQYQPAVDPRRAR
ncbi:unannotated protein [freshwater metagenome]|uniref:Unannotated protein n=1 Tax=freshwater metagenome TaxID=449393 RepID=A0A6J7K622_9ZZZZ